MPRESQAQIATAAARPTKAELLARVVALSARLDARGAAQIDGAARNVVDLLLNELLLDLIRHAANGTARDADLSRRARARIAALRGLSRVPVWGRVREEAMRFAPRTGDVVFVPVEPTHIDQLVPIAQEARARALVPLFFTNRRAIAAGLRERGWPTRAYNHLLVRSAPTAFDAPRALAALHEANRDGERLFDRDQLAVLTDTILRVRRQLDELVHQTRRLLEDARPAAVVVGNDLTIEGRVCAAMARQTGAASFSIMHGNVTGEPQNAHHVVDKFFTYGEAGREVLVGYGLPADRVEVTGAPYLDARLRERRAAPRVLRDRLGLAPSTRVVLVGLSGRAHSIERFERLIDAIVRAAAPHPELHVVFKLHRQDRRAFYEVVTDRYPNARLSVVEHEAPGFPRTIFDYFAESDVLVTVTSTVAVEAILLELPVITACLYESGAGVDFIDSGATWTVRSEAELGDALGRVARGESDAAVRDRARRFRAHFWGETDGRSAARVVDAIVRASPRLRRGAA